MEPYVQSSIPKWVPKAARDRITELQAEPWLNGAGRKLLDRLASYPTMKTEVWEKLPPEPEGAQGQIIGFAFTAVTMFAELIPRPGKKAKRAIWQKWSKILHENPPGSTPEYASLLAVSLLQALCELKAPSSAYWGQFWQGDPSVTVDNAIDLIEELALFYDRMAKEHKRHADLLPKIKRPFSDSAPQVFFTQLMSSRLEALYKRPLDSVVTALAEVAFNLPEGIEEETVRARRRSTNPVEKSRRKTT